MIEPVRMFKARPIFYRINRDTSLNIDDIKSKINDHTKAIIVTHYFGFSQNLDTIRQICDQYSLTLIEDCAHSFFGQCGDVSMGLLGDFAIASSMKFFPVYDGGILASNQNNLDQIKLSPPPLLFQLKSLVSMIDNAIQYKRLGIIGAIARLGLLIKTLIWSVIKKLRRLPADNRIGPSSSDGGFGLDEDWIHKDASCISTRVIQASDFRTISVARRRNYLKLEHALKSLPGCHALFEYMPDSTVPLVFPLYVDNAKIVFPELKRAGVPIWRFGEYLDSDIDDTVCPVSIDYSERIFQFPCHQSLTNEEIDWMIGQIKYSINNS